MAAGAVDAVPVDVEAAVVVAPATDAEGRENGNPSIEMGDDLHRGLVIHLPMMAHSMGLRMVVVEKVGMTIDATREATTESE